MVFLIPLLLVLGVATADHHPFHQPAAVSFQEAPLAYPGASLPLQSGQAFAIPIQVYSASVAPVTPAPQVYTATLSPTPAHQIFLAAAAPQYPVHNVEVHSYSAPAPAPAQQYVQPVRTVPIPPPKYSPPKTYTPTFTVKHQAPVVKYQAPVLKYQAPTLKYQTPSVKYQDAIVTQVTSPAYSSHYVKPVAILRQSQDSNFDGSFSYDFQAENGISSQASGYLKALSAQEDGQVMQGQYSYTAPDGTPIVTRWFADETGFHAEGAHLPVPPPVPEAIAKSLAYHATPSVSHY